MAVQQPSVNAGLRPPPSAADGVDRGLPDSRWHLIDQWPGAASHAWQILCQIIGHRRIYADSRRHRQLPAVIALWRGDYAHDGRYWSFPTATSVPKPLQQPYPPLWVAARDPDTYDWAIAQGCSIQSWAIARPFS